MFMKPSLAGCTTQAILTFSFAVTLSPEIASSGGIIAPVCVFDERTNLWWIISLQQTANGKCAKVNGHCRSNHLSSLIKEEFRKEESVHSWPGKLTDGEGDELHCLFSVLGKGFTGKPYSQHSRWDQCCRQLRLGLLKTEDRFTRACLWSVSVRTVMLHHCKTWRPFLPPFYRLFRFFPC